MEYNYMNKDRNLFVYLAMSILIQLIWDTQIPWTSKLKWSIAEIHNWSFLLHNKKFNVSAVLLSVEFHADIWQMTSLLHGQS